MILEIVVVLLALVDVAALTIGISIRRKVTRIVEDTAKEIEDQVRAGIHEAVGRFGMLAAEVFKAQGKEDLGDRLLEELKR